MQFLRVPCDLRESTDEYHARCLDSIPSKAQSQSPALFLSMTDGWRNQQLIEIGVSNRSTIAIVRPMGCCRSLCASPKEAKAAGQFQSLVTPKPLPVSIVDVAPDPESDVPLFATAPSDDDPVEISDIDEVSGSDGSADSKPP
jgi:hypothetical protein